MSRFNDIPGKLAAHINDLESLICDANALADRAALSQGGPNAILDEKYFRTKANAFECALAGLRRALEVGGGSRTEIMRSLIRDTDRRLNPP